MAEVDFTELLPDIAADVAGVNEPAIARCARMAARYFCDRTGALTYTAAAVDIVAGTPTYTIPADPDGRVIVGATDVKVDGVSLIMRSAHQLDREQPNPYANYDRVIGLGSVTFNTFTRDWRTFEAYPPLVYHQDTPQTVRLVGIPNQASAGGLVVTASLKPSRIATSIDESILENWYECLVLGTKAFILQMPQKSWTNVQLGMSLQAGFEAKVEEIHGTIVSGFAPNDHVVGHVRAYP